jgi:hypothetical protein
MRKLIVVAALLAFGAVAAPASLAAQGKGVAKSKDAPGKTKNVTPSAAIVVVRDVFSRNGYDVVRVEQVGGTQVVYYRRGNMGKGKGQGPLEKMIVRPSGNIVVFEGGPSGLLVDVRLKLGL